MAPAAWEASASPRREPLSPKTGPSAASAIPGAQPFRWKAVERARSILASSERTGRNVRAG
eukprot:15473170-Alexandrium_andersonii.AAC.1